MTTYVLTERSAGDLIRAVFGIYSRHFSTLFITYAVLSLPFSLLLAVTNEIMSTPWRVFLNVLSAVPSSLAVSALTVCVGDICIGQEPSAWRAYRQVGHGVWAKALATGVLQILAILLGLVLLVIPGLVMAIWFLPASCVVVLEGTWGRAALARSRNLISGMARLS